MKKKHVLACVAGLLLACCGAATAQSVTPEQANEWFQAQDWPQAEAAYAALVRHDAANAAAWYRLGYARHLQQKYAAAADAWLRADSLGFAPVRARYNVASAYARLDRADDAFAWLEKAVQAGFGQVQQLETDPDLENLRADPRFDALRTAADKNARPCHYDARYRQFDFWIGDWDVTTPQGQQAGTNTIEKILNDCVLLENWLGASAAPGGGGKSFNYYDANAGKWKQLWVDAGGNTSSFTGEFKDGAMRFEGVWTNRNGTTSRMKMTFTPLEDGRVRQYIEQSLDEGATWNVWFDGFYVRQPSEASE